MRSKNEDTRQWSGIRLSLSLFWHERKVILLVCGLAVVMRVLAPYLGILMPRVVIEQIEARVEPLTFVLVVGSLALLMMAVSYIKAFSDSITNSAASTVGINCMVRLSLARMLSVDYELMEDPKYKEVDAKAFKAMATNQTLAMNIPRLLVELFSNSIGFLLYASIIVFIHPLVLLALLITAAVNWLMLSRVRKYMASTRDTRSNHAKKLQVLSDTMRKREAAKDIRLYGAVGWLSGLYRRQYNEYRKAERRLLTKQMQSHLTDALMILLRDGAAYVFLVYLVLNNRLSLGEFVFAFAAVGALAGWVSGILTAASDLSKANIEMNDIVAMLNFPDRMNTGKGIPLPTGSELPPSIEMNGVSYTYPKAKDDALKDINIKIRPGERIAIVGVNGAGKTTLVKLLCGLYTPTKGDVLYNGNPINAYNRDDYYSQFSVAFQDIHLTSASIAENIAFTIQPDGEKLVRCLEITGFNTKVQSLPDKENTLLVRVVNHEAIELSGGEKQKLAMARALYKDAPVIILDEPTAALDPLAENEIYRQYAKLTEGKTSVYISHRLASTRFCDRILLIEGNRIMEQGNHDELMALGGTYARMFEVQASYYQNDNAEGAMA